MQSPMLASMLNGLSDPNEVELKLSCQLAIRAESAIGTSQRERPLRAARDATGAAALIAGFVNPRACRPSLVKRSAAPASYTRALQRGAMVAAPGGLRQR